MRGIRVTTLNETPVKAWLIQGTVFPELVDAKRAAMLMFASLLNDGVVVKRVAGGWSCFWWRQK